MSGDRIAPGYYSPEVLPPLSKTIEVEIRERRKRELVASDEEVRDPLVEALRAHGIRVRAKQAEESGEPAGE